MHKVEAKGFIPPIKFSRTLALHTCLSSDVISHWPGKSGACLLVSVTYTINQRMENSITKMNVRQLLF